MIGKKRMKRRIAQFMGLTMGLAMGLMFSMNAMAGSDRKTATLAGVKIIAFSSIGDTWGDGYTKCEDPCILGVTVKIRGTYRYVHPVTGEGGSYSSGWRQGQSSVSISYSAPNGYRFLSLQCDHEADYAGQHWSCSTAATYP